MNKRRDVLLSVVNRLGLPSELVNKVPRTTLQGQDRVQVENHGGIKTYGEEMVEIRVRNGLLRIRGDGLKLAAMTSEEIIIRGLVVSLEYC